MILDLPTRSEARRDALILALLAAVLFLAATGARDLWNPNEPIYGQAVVEMADRGEWLVPTVNGVVFAEKPILYFWAARVTSAALGGVSEFSLRLPSAVAAVIGVVLVYFLVVPYGGRRRARLAAVILATTYGIFWGARTVQMDVLVTVTTLGVLLPLSRVLDHRLAPWKGWAWAGFAAGLGLLAKGPVALILPALVYAGYVLVTRRPRQLVRPAMLLALAVTILVAGPWYLALWLQGETAFLNELLLRQNLTRFVQAWDHQASWHYYLVNFWIDMAPWGFFVPLAAALPDRDTGEKRLDTLAWVWIVAIVVFFSLAQSKRSFYILPVAPAVAVLVSGLAARWFEGRLSRWRSTGLLALASILAATLVAAGGVMLLRVAPDYPDLAWPARGLAAVCIAGGVAALIVAALRRRRRTTPAILLGTVVAIYLVGAIWALPAANGRKSARPFCQELVARAAEDDTIVSYRLWRYRGSYAFYSRRSIEPLETPEALRAAWMRQEKVFVVVEKGRVEEVRTMLGGVEPVYERAIGSNAAYLFVNR